MSLWWSYFWPVAAAGLALGAFTGLVSFRRNRKAGIAVGALLALAAAAVWHSPLGAADKFASAVERDARATLDYYEMTKVSGRLYRRPLTRNIDLEGPADDFQQGELVRLMSMLPGVRNANWSGERGLPLLVEGFVAALLGFLVGLLLAYLVELRRRYNSQWKW